METIYFLGIDVAKETFQAALTVDGVDMFEQEVPNNVKAIRTYLMLGELPSMLTRIVRNSSFGHPRV